MESGEEDNGEEDGNPSDQSDLDASDSYIEKLYQRAKLGFVI